MLLALVLCFTLLPHYTVFAAVKISKAKATMEVDSYLRLKVTGYAGDITWTSSKKAIATVNNTGTVTAVTEGKAYITAKAGSKKITCSITVVDSNKSDSKAKPTPTPTIYSEGTLKVGSDIPAGEYVIFKKEAEWNGYYRLASAKDSTIKNDLFETNSIISIKEGEILELNRSYAVPIDKAKVDISNEGCFKVGLHIPEGVYKIEIIDEINTASYCIINSNREFDNVKYFKQNENITVEDGQYLNLRNCKLVK